MSIQVTMHAAEKYALDTHHLTEEGISFLMQNFGCTRKIKNLYVAWLYDELEKAGYVNGPIPDMKLPEVTAFKKREELSYLKDADSLALANAKQDFERSVRTFNKQYDHVSYTKRALRRDKSGKESLSFRGLKGFPKFHSRARGDFSYTTNCQYPAEGNNLKNPTVRLEGKMLYVPKFRNGFRLVLHRRIPDDAVIGNVTFSKDTDGKFYVSISYSYILEMNGRIREAVMSPDTPESRDVIDSLKFLGLDYSQQDFYVDSEGRKANYPHYYRVSEGKLAKLQRKLSHMQEDSSNYREMQKKISLLNKKIARQRLDFVRKEAKYLSDSYDVIAVEDIDLRGMGGALSLGKNLHDNGFGMFREILSHKLEKKGSVLVKIDRFYASSKTCHECGYVNKELKLSDRDWTCPVCGTYHDRDGNAAVNIEDEGRRIFADYYRAWLADDEQRRKKAASLSSARKKKKAA